ncbi:MAG: hypothetical protein LBT37_02985 [Lactobacillaceae bacterium]|jgi:multisubunit Na+/H+ antiporter MnhB subunit|nr:hypothetical protein [Lactobacillaceae bacterium]
MQLLIIGLTTVMFFVIYSYETWLAHKSLTDAIKQKQKVLKWWIAPIGTVLLIALVFFYLDLGPDETRRKVIVSLVVVAQVLAEFISALFVPRAFANDGKKLMLTVYARNIILLVAIILELNLIG